MAKASTISCSTADIESYAVITINTEDRTYLHDLTYEFKGLTGTIGENVTGTTSISWYIPSTFYAKIPNDKSGWGVITCKTYSGSTLIGTKTSNFCVTCNESKCRPTLSPTAVDTNSNTIALTGNSSKFVRGKSWVTAEANASANNSATLQSWQIICGGQGSYSSDGVSTIFYPESNKFVFTARDSRNFVTQITQQYDFVDYFKPTCNLSVNAPTTDGEVFIDISGEFFNGSFGASNNTLTVYYKWNDQTYDPVTNSTSANHIDWTALTVTKSGNQYSGSTTLTGFDYQKRYTFQAKAVDKLETIESSLNKIKSTPVFDWSRTDFNFNVPVNFSDNIKYKNNDLDFVVESYWDDTWSYGYRLWNNGTAEYWKVKTHDSIFTDTTSYDSWVGKSNYCNSITYPKQKGKSDKIFINPPAVFMKADGGYDNNGDKLPIISVITDGSGDKDNTSRYSFLYLGGIAGVIQNVTLYVYAIGRWKP